MYAVTVSGASRIIFQAGERLQFLTCVDFFIKIYSFARPVCHVYTILLRREHSTIVEGQRLLSSIEN